VGAGEEVRYGLGEVPQRLLLYHLAARPQWSRSTASWAGEGAAGTWIYEHASECHWHSGGGEAAFRPGL